MEIRSHHQRAIDRLADTYRDDERFRGLIVVGSVAKGFAREDSDVDFMIIASDEEFRQRQTSGDLFINRTDLSDYAGGFVDGKIIDLAYLRQVADHGNEPTRAAFSHVAGLDALLNQIRQYPEDGHDERVKAFYCMTFMQHWLMHEGERDGLCLAKRVSAGTLVIGRIENGLLFLALA